MTPPVSHDELLRLLADHCADRLGEADAQRLADALAAGAEARRVYIEYMDLHSSLAWECSSAADLDTHFAERESPPAEQRPTLGSVLRKFVSTPQRLAFSVASLVVVAVLGLLAFTPVPPFKPRADDTNPWLDRVVVADITDTVDCRWDETALPVGHGNHLYKGQQVELLEGSAEITFHSGAVVTLTGPAVFVVDAASRSSLRRGELTARVPRRAKGFAVNTPTAVVVDLGTEFGVIVTPGEDGAAAVEEVHVFTGRVEVEYQKADLPKQRLTANEAVRISVAGEQVEVEQLAASERDRFPQDIAPNGDSTLGQPLPPDQHPPVTQGLTLWLSADGATRVDLQGRVGVWEDMRTGDNTRAQNATQNEGERRPVIVADAIAGHPAVRFDGDDFLYLTTPANLGLQGEPYEMFIVARTSSPEIQFLTGGGFEDFELHINGDAGARFIPVGHVTVDDYSDLGKTAQFSDGRAHIFSARVLADAGHHGVVAVDGKKTSDAIQLDCRSGNNATLRLGMRSDNTYALRGEIAEVLIYRGELTAQQRQMVGRDLSQKYEVATQF